MRGDSIHPPVPPPGDAFRRTLGGLLLATCVACMAQDSHPAPPPGDKPATVQAPEAGNPAKMTKQQKTEAADNERKKQITDESTQLLTMALALKAEVDKTNKDTLSINVIRKADQIEKLAHTVKEKMKQSAGAS